MRWSFFTCITALTHSIGLAGPGDTDGLVIISASIKQSSCVPEFKLNINEDKPVQLPKISNSNFKRNSLSAVSFFSLKLDSVAKPQVSGNNCSRDDLFSGIEFDSTPNATSLLGTLKNQATENPAKNVDVELILFNSNWTQQYKVDLQNKEAIDFNKIPGWTQDKQAKKVNQLNFAVRYTKDASTFEEVTPGMFYVVLPFMLKFN